MELGRSVSSACNSEICGGIWGGPASISCCLSNWILELSGLDVCVLLEFFGSVKPNLLERLFITPEKLSMLKLIQGWLGQSQKIFSKMYTLNCSKLNIFTNLFFTVGQILGLVSINHYCVLEVPADTLLYGFLVH